MAKPIIGSIEQVQIVSHGDELVLAKIDTGAESSSIWATQVSQDSGVLHYVLFGPGSVYYSGKVRTSKRFKVTTVKSSFGHSETRYKVLLEIKIGKHRIKGWFTLADRSRNTYPILLGKSLLKDQFLVDVSMNHVHSDGSLEKKVLVISSSPETAGFLKNVQKVSANHINYDVLDFEHILFDINGDMSDVINSTNGESLAEYALTYVKSHWKYPEPASALAEYLKFKNRSLVDEELFHYTSRSKLSEMMNLAVHGLPVPRSYVGYKTALVDQADSIIKSLGFPLVMKNVTSDKGKDNFFIEDEKVYYAILENAAGMDIYAVQEYIPNDGFY
ncbi:MAG TPA: RimK/LysX family protein, partial [Dongiaceae bacterium]|nr:RimK/LysX family protein [Dongiaceae bacterium]